MIVVDASVLANAIGDDGADGREARALLRQEVVAIPDLADVEVASVLRRSYLGGRLTRERFGDSLADLAALAVPRYPARPFLRRVGELADHVSAYDAVYVALAEALGCDLATADHRLARAGGMRCGVRMVTAAS